MDLEALKQVARRPISPRKVPDTMPKFLGVGGAHLKPYVFTHRQKKFLDIYSESLDSSLAREESGLSASEVEKNEYLQKQMQWIERNAMLQFQSSQVMVKGNHMRLMEKFEDDYNNPLNFKSAPSLASTLAKMSDAAMKAAGVYGDDKLSDVQKVQVNVIFPGQSPPDTVDVEVKDEQ